MGKKQHQSDKMYISANEWKRDFGGFKGTAQGERVVLPLDCCSLSFLPFGDHPVCDPQGHIFDLENIVPYVNKFHKNPVTNQPLQLSELIKLHFSRNAEGELQDPTTFKTFSSSTHVVAIKPTGNVYAFESIDQLCIKAKSMRDLLNDQPFTRADLITLQDPQRSSDRDFSNFVHIKDEQVAKQVQEIKSTTGSSSSNSSATPVAATAAAASTSSSSLTSAPAPSPSRPKLNISLAAKPPSAAAAAAASLQSNGPARGLFSSGAVASSFTSTGVSVSTLNDRSALTPEQILTQHYTHLRKKKAKGYVRLHTNKGNINLELAVDLAPATCHNFLELCERQYYNNTIFHRVIPGFMMQGGDPTGTGRGGEGAFAKEFKDEFHSALRHNARGVLAMANSGPNTNASQFYITFDACSHLDNKHSVFGRVVGGMEVLDAVEKVETSRSASTGKAKDRPVNDVTITAVTVYTNPFKDKFVPVDELTGKKAQESAPVEPTSEVGAWFSNPTAATATTTANGDGLFKYMQLPQPTVDSVTGKRSVKRKEAPSGGEEKRPPTSTSNMHPAQRAAALSAAANATSTTPSPPAASASAVPATDSAPADEEAALFAAARNRLQAQKAIAASHASASYGNFSNF